MTGLSNFRALHGPPAWLRAIDAAGGLSAGLKSNLASRLSLQIGTIVPSCTGHRMSLPMRAT